MIWAIIPVKPLRESKSRLAGVLTTDERADLTSRLLQRTLTILRQVPALDRVMVVSRDPVVLKIARQGGAMTLVEGDKPGLNTALRRAAYVAAAQWASGLLILPCDLPLLTVADVEMMLTGAKPTNGLRPVNGHSNGHHLPNGQNGHHADPQNGHQPLNGHHTNGTNGHDAAANHQPRAMTICPDHHEDGTNALFIQPGTDFAFHYGLGSFNLHLEEAKRQNMFYRVVHAPGIKFDLDTENDWSTYRTVAPQGL